MLLTIANLLSPEDLKEVRELAATLSWRDGTETAGSTAKAVKQNLQADLSSRTGTALKRKMMKAIEHHPVLRAAAHPKRFSRLLLSRTCEGGGYGYHIDNAFMGSGEHRVRTDVSFTVFLSDKDSYDGGELVIEDAGSSQIIKPNAGDLVLYPTVNIHQVATVTRGERLAFVGWIESLIPDPSAREILFDLENLRASLSPHHDPQSPEMLTLAKTISRLMRRFNAPY